MENVIFALDEYFCAHYSDYVRISALKGYAMPTLLRVGSDANLEQLDRSLMRLKYQKNAPLLLKEFKDGFTDTDFSFSFAFRPLRDKICDPFRKYTFAKVLPKILEHCGESVESAGKLLSVEPRFWNMIARGKVYPEKGTVLALALVCRMKGEDVRDLLNVCGFSLEDTNVRDVVVRYLLEQQVFSPALRDACLKEYHITTLPIAEAVTEGDVSDIS